MRYFWLCSFSVLEVSNWGSTLWSSQRITHPRTVDCTLVCAWKDLKTYLGTSFIAKWKSDKLRQKGYIFFHTSVILAMPQSKSDSSEWMESNFVASRTYRMFWVLPSVTDRRSSSVSAWFIPTARTVTPNMYTIYSNYTSNILVLHSRLLYL